MSLAVVEAKPCDRWLRADLAFPSAVLDLLIFAHSLYWLQFSVQWTLNHVPLCWDKVHRLKPVLRKRSRFMIFHLECKECVGVRWGSGGVKLLVLFKRIGEKGV